VSGGASGRGQRSGATSAASSECGGGGKCGRRARTAVSLPPPLGDQGAVQTLPAQQHALAGLVQGLVLLQDPQLVRQAVVPHPGPLGYLGVRIRLPADIAFDGGDDHERFSPSALDELRYSAQIPVSPHLDTEGRAGEIELAHQLKGARWALWHNPENLTDHQQATLEALARLNQPLYRAYLLKEALRLLFHMGWRRALKKLQPRLTWARRSRLQPFAKLARTITAYRPSIEAALRYRISNALAESINQKIRLIIRRSFGFRSAEAIIAVAKLSLGGLCPPLPDRS